MKTAGKISFAMIFTVFGTLLGYLFNNYLGEGREIERDLYKARLEAYQVFAEGQALRQHAEGLNNERLRRQATDDGDQRSGLFSLQSIDKVMEEANRNINRGKFLLAVTASDETISTFSRYSSMTTPTETCEQRGVAGELEIENYMAFRRDILRRASDRFEDKRDLVTFLFNCTLPRTPVTGSTESGTTN